MCRANALACVTVLGLVASNLRFATKRHWQRARRPLQWACSGVLGGLMIYFTAQAWRRGGEILWTTRADLLPKYSTEEAAARQKALAWEPKNYLTASKIGDCFRIQSLDGGEDYASLAQTALNFYAQGIRLNPHDAYCQLGSGRCLDWLGRHGEAEKYYAAAEMRDPNGNFIVANIGLHYVEAGDYAAARQWFIRASKLSNERSQIAINYLFNICQPKLEQKASGELPMGLFYNGKDN
jgi:tetratricopeptide (TPR) repeat protein